MSLFFFFNDTATTEIYTLSLHDALPICIVPPLQPLQALVVDIAEPEDVRQHDPFGIEPAPLRNDPDAVEGKTLQPLRPLGREVSLQPDKIPLALQLGFQLARVRLEHTAETDGRGP